MMAETQSIWWPAETVSVVNDRANTSESTTPFDKSEKWHEWPFRKLSHVLLAENLKTTLKQQEKRIDIYGKKLENKEQELQISHTLLNNFLSSYAEWIVKQDSAYIDFHQSLLTLWFKDIQDFLDFMQDEKRQQEFKWRYSKKEQEGIWQALNELYMSYLTIILWDKKIESIENQIRWVKEQIKKVLKQSSNIQSKIDKTEEDMEKTLSEWLLEQCLYLWQEATLQDSVLWKNVDSQLKNIIDMYKNREFIEKHGLKLPKAVLLFWDINSWKSFAAKVLSTEIWRDMYIIKEEDICWWKFWSDPIAALGVIFSRIVEQKKSCIIFLDWIDQILDIFKGSAEYKQIVWNTILSHMMDIKDSDLDIMIIWGITNKNAVDDRFLKYDNFEEQIFLPDFDDEKLANYFEILKNKYKSKNVEFLDVDEKRILEMFSNYPKDVIKKLVDMAVKNAAVRNIWLWWDIINVEYVDFEKAFSTLKSSENYKNKKYL